MINKNVKLEEFHTKCATVYLNTQTLALFRMGFFGAAHGWGGGGLFCPKK